MSRTGPFVTAGGLLYHALNRGVDRRTLSTRRATTMLPRTSGTRRYGRDRGGPPNACCPTRHEPASSSCPPAPDSVTVTFFSFSFLFARQACALEPQAGTAGACRRLTVPGRPAVAGRGRRSRTGRWPRGSSSLARTGSADRAAPSRPRAAARRPGSQGVGTPRRPRSRPPAVGAPEPMPGRSTAGLSGRRPTGDLRRIGLVPALLGPWREAAARAPRP